jgi:hypothetical protein
VSVKRTTKARGNRFQWNLAIRYRIERIAQRSIHFKGSASQERIDRVEPTSVLSAAENRIANWLKPTPRLIAAERPIDATHLARNFLLDGHWIAVGELPSQESSVTIGRVRLVGDGRRRSTTAGKCKCE